jgi:hypothetical protein
MKRSSLVVLLSGLLAIMALFYAGWEKYRAGGFHSLIAVEVRRKASLQEQTEQREKLVARLSSGGEKQRTIALAGTKNRPPSRTRLRLDQRIRSNLDFRYRSAFAKLGWSADQIAQWEILAVKLAEDLSDIRAAARDLDIAPDDPAIAKLLALAQDDYKASMVAGMGDDAYLKFQQLDRVQPATEFVAAVAGRVFGSGISMSPAAMDQLGELIAGASPDYQAGNRVNLSSVDWNAVQAQAQQLLAPQQLAALQSIQSDFQIRTRLTRLLASLKTAGQ